jgi:hypothetical protein
MPVLTARHIRPATQHYVRPKHRLAAVVAFLQQPVHPMRWAGEVLVELRDLPGGLAHDYRQLSNGWAWSGFLGLRRRK